MNIMMIPVLLLAALVFSSSASAADDHVTGLRGLAEMGDDQNEDQSERKLVTEHNNDVLFSTTGSIESVSCVEKGHSIRSEQPYSGTTCTYLNRNEFRIRVKAGRKKSTQAGNFFTYGMYDYNAIGAATSARLPSELNFAVLLDLTIVTSRQTYVIKDFRVGQGNRGSTNNWWIGQNPDCVTIDNDVLTCAGSGVEFTDKSHKTFEFWLL